MLCPDCTRLKRIEIEMDHIASYNAKADAVAYEEFCSRCGATFKGVLTRVESRFNQE